uniref:Uncharacterized protein n=1 Tax=Glossina pallidipes TaxID=7398 RepID=A0A1B0A711_GLOPL
MLRVDSNKISSLYEDDNDGPDGLMMMKDYIMTKHITSHVNVAATTRTRTATTKTTRTKTPETAATATAEAAATATTTTTTITRTTKTTMKPIILSTTATTLMSNNLMPLRTYFNNKNHIKNLSSLSLLSINETTSLTLPSYYSSSYTSLPSSSLSSSSSSSSSSLANAIALRLNGNPGNVNSNRSRLFAGTSNNATIVTAIALKSTMPTKIANSISNSNNYDPSNSTISSALGSISLSNVNGNDTKTINNSSSSRSSSSSSSSSNSNIVTRVSARKVDSKYTLPKSHKTDAPMLNYIFDTFSSANKHHHHDQSYRGQRLYPL